MTHTPTRLRTVIRAINAIRAIAVSLFFLGMLATPELLAATDRLLVTGTAYNLKTGNLAYREYHDISTTQHHVRYVDATETLLASKSLRYSHGFNTPEYQLHDRRLDKRTGSQWENGHFIISRQEKSGKPIQEIIKPDKNTVIDAGFDHFIREHWDALVDGKTLPFSFVVSDPLTVLRMELMEVSAAHTAISQHNEHYRYFVARSRNKLISWAIPEIHLAYDRNTRLLQVYQGPSNITDSQDKTQTVNIRYEYQEPATAGNAP